MSQILSGSLLAASMLLGQTGGPVQQPPTRGPILGWFQREDRPVLSRIQGWFRRDQQEMPPKGKIVQPMDIKRDTNVPPVAIPPVNDFPKKLPNPSGQGQPKPAPNGKTEPAAVQQTSVQQTTVNKAKSPILASLSSRIGRDEKFEWITGQLEIENGNYVLYYATPETIDVYHGRIVLAPQQADMSVFRKGDLVSVRGQLVQRPAGNSAVVIYRVNFASLIERPKAL
jgi:hypothetical protein